MHAHLHTAYTVSRLEIDPPQFPPFRARRCDREFGKIDHEFGFIIPSILYDLFDSGATFAVCTASNDPVRGGACRMLSECV